MILYVARDSAALVSLRLTNEKGLDPHQLEDMTMFRICQVDASTVMEKKDGKKRKASFGSRKYGFQSSLSKECVRRQQNEEEHFTLTWISADLRQSASSSAWRS